MDKRFGGGNTGFAAAPCGDAFMMLPPDALAVLAQVSKQRGLLLFEHGRDIDVSVGCETLRLAAAVDFEKVKMRAARQRHAGADRAHAGDLMVHVRVNRPMSENHVRSFRREEFLKLIDTGAGEVRRTVDLARKHRSGADNLACRLALERPDPGGFIERLPGNPPL